MDFLFWWRVANTAIAVVALVYLMLDLRIVRYELNTRRLYLTFSLAGMLLAVIVGSITHIAQDNPIGVQIPITTAACLWCIIGLWISRHQRSPIWKEVPK